jgi:transcriptional regulator GlxA family with amidase domain
MIQRVVVLVCEGFTDSGVTVLLDVFRTANAIAGERFRVALASPDGGPVRGSSGLVTASTRSARTATRAGVLLVPGLWVEKAADLDRTLERADVRVAIRTIRSAHRRGAIVGGSCAGTFLMAESGVLDGARATTTWWLARHFERRYPKVKLDADAALVVHRRLLSAGAAFGVADLALHLVARFCGPTIAHRCSSALLLDRHPSQAPYMAMHQLAANDPCVRRAETWVRAHLDEAFDIATLAKNAGTSPRTLARRLVSAVGLSPIAFVRELRVETALHLLRTTKLDTSEISAKVGYADPTTLRRLLRWRLDASPRQLRGRV